ncbi:MAG: acyl-ACP--UDP-N-acetylglucosamine O-acyltransferase, partial [Mucinivorans sp.]
PNAKLGIGVIVEPFAYIASEVTIGDNTWVGPHATILDGAIIGHNCKIHSGAVVSGIPQDLKFRGEKSTAIIGNNTTIRECATINRGTAARGETTVGDNCLIMAYVHIGHDCVVGNNVILVNRVSLAGEVQVDDWAILGGHTAVHQFCKIGAHAMVSGGSMILKDVTPYIKAGHYPLTYVGINAIGLRRRGFTTEHIAGIQDMCRILFQSSMIYSAACDKIEQEIAPSQYRDEMVNFVRSSKRGILKPFSDKLKDEDLDQ